jgi:hypothetical protein
LPRRKTGISSARYFGQSRNKKRNIIKVGITAERKMAVELRSRFPRTGFTELAAADPEVWAKESFDIATKIAYQNSEFRGTPKGNRRDCREVTDAAVVPKGYTGIARKITDRRMILSGYRLADLLQRISANRVP